jgi:PAS domain S-box-containing protein
MRRRDDEMMTRRTSAGAIDNAVPERLLAAERTIARQKEELRAVHDELQRTNSELLQLTLELDDRVAERTEELRKSEEELRRHRDHLQELVGERTARLKDANDQLEQKLRELKASEERFRSLVVTIPDIVYRIDEAGYFMFINDAVRRLGYEGEELIGAHFSEIVLPADLDAVSRSSVLPRYEGKQTGDSAAPKLFDERRTGSRRTTGLEVRLLAKDRRRQEPALIQNIGERDVIAEVNSSGLYAVNSRGEGTVHIGTVGVIRDITDRKRMEEALRRSYEESEKKVEERTAELRQVNESLQQQVEKRKRIEAELKKLLHDLEQSQSTLIETEKIAALGTLTAGVAHELNNPMMGIINFIQYCLQKTAKDDIRYGVLADAEHEAKRCARIVHDLLTFSRIKKEEDEQYQRESCDAILERVLRLLSYRIEKDGVTVARETAAGTPEILMKPSNIQQVFLNIVGNALDAVRECPKKEISVRVDGDERFVRVDVTDTGSGIPPGIMTKIFDPFFTTKPVGFGTGLGLSVSRSIIASHGGEITCTSRPGEGTTFHLVLPVRQTNGEENVHGQAHPGH